MRTGKEHRQLNLFEGRKGHLRQPRPRCHALRGSCGGDVFRREGTGHHLRTENRDSRTSIPHSYTGGWHESARHHLRPQRACYCHRYGGTQRIRGRLHTCHGMDTPKPSGSTRQRRCEQSLVLFPRQQLYPRSHARRVPLPRHSQRHGLRHCQPCYESALQRHSRR